jgi:hypothetical protein
MRKALFVIVFTAAGVLATSAHLIASKSEESRSHQAARQMADETMRLLEQGDLPAMFASLKQKFDLPEAELSSLENMLDHQRRLMASKAGKSVGVEFVAADEIGDSLVRFTYLEKFEKSALVWRMILYRPTDNWRLHELSWDDKPKGLFH